MKKIKIIVEGPQGIGKSYIANVIHRALKNHSIESFGEDIQQNFIRQTAYCRLR